MKPFLKWAGSKYRIVEQIKAVLPPGKRLVEPFAGSAAVFLNTHYPANLLADANGDLIQLYQHLQSEGQPFIEFCQTFFQPPLNNPTTYYTFRAEFNKTADSHRKSALFLYLNRHCYNGLCRYNAKGEFNVPFGRYRKPYFPATEMQTFHHKAAHATFQQGDFADIMQNAQPGDVVYCDPPYAPLSQTAKFTSYSTKVFNTAHQLRLVQEAQTLAQRGIPVIISNHSTPFTQQAYNGAVFTEFDVRRYISCNGSSRNKVTELLAIFQ